MKKTALIFLCGCLLGYFAWSVRVWISNELPISIATLPDSAEYYGPLLDGSMHGDGRLRWRNGDRYIGAFDQGLMHGKGRLEQSNGIIYDGDFNFGQMHGEGTLRYSDTEYYEGSFAAGRQHGRGKFIQPDLEYIGDFKLGFFNGQGTWKSDGNLYVGEFSDHKFHGNGMYIKASGDIYEGEFVNGSFSGNGQLRNDIGTYEGEFKDWSFEGDGTYKVDGNGTYRGHFTSDELNGEGFFESIDGEQYEGEFVDSIYHGNGRIVTSSGDVYEGQFKYGFYHGNGILVPAGSNGDTSKIEGEWNYGELVATNSPEFINQSPTSKLEALIYGQHDLLQASIDQLLPNDPEQTDLYFLAVAGDGTEKVFENEVTSVRDYFDKNLQTKNRSMVLINSKRSIDEYPLATKTSFSLALNTIAERMDHDDDILFLFLTSHGSRKHSFSLDHDALSLNNMQVEWLAGTINETPIQWKVIVVSACFSGGFIPPLADEKTLIITASAADKNSFGCGDLTEHTYFGDAYFKQALPQTHHFIDAFDVALNIISEREQEQGFEPSNPQIHQPDAILQKLSEWRQQLITD